ncbi:MAG: DUF5677 domain-containing protein, partial [Terriglobales bacterium]
FHAPTIVRTMFESFADLRALAADGTYEQRMKLHAANERKKTIDGYINTYAEMEEFARTVQRARSDLEYLEKEIKKLTDESIRDYKVWERFQLAGLEGGKVYIYGELSSFTHADYIAIMLRHIGKDKILLGASLPDWWFAKGMFLASTILLDGLLTLPSFATVDEARLGALRDEAIKYYERLPSVS